MPKPWLLFLAVYACMGCAAGEMRERFQDEDSFQATVKQAEEAAESGNRPIQYPVSNQWIKKNAARFLSSKLRDDKHNGDKTKFFNQSLKGRPSCSI